MISWRQPLNIAKGRLQPVDLYQVEEKVFAVACSMEIIS